MLTRISSIMVETYQSIEAVRRGFKSVLRLKRKLYTSFMHELRGFIKRQAHDAAKAAGDAADQASSNALNAISSGFTHGFIGGCVSIDFFIDE